jgi:hypothetical protein
VHAVVCPDQLRVGHKGGCVIVPSNRLEVSYPTQEINRRDYMQPHCQGAVETIGSNRDEFAYFPQGDFVT